MEKPFLLDENNEKLEQCYKEDNYREVIMNPESNLCYIFFSSNGIYFPNTFEIFEETILQKDKYEWKRTAYSEILKKKIGKAIWVRDIYKTWYHTGINSKINSIEKLCTFLKEITLNYDVITCGCSSGGYAATIVGIELNAKLIFNFSGHWSLTKHFDNYPQQNDSFIRSHANTAKWDILDYLDGNRIPIMWFYSGRCIQDLIQREELDSKSGDNSIYPFAMNSEVHGFSLLDRCADYVICMNENELINLYSRYKNKLINQRAFCFRTMPVNMAAKSIFKDIVRCHKSLQILIGKRVKRII